MHIYREWRKGKGENKHKYSGNIVLFPFPSHVVGTLFNEKPINNKMTDWKTEQRSGIDEYNKTAQV